MTSTFRQFSIEKRTEAYWRITFNNPPLNLIGPESVLELSGIVDVLEASQELSVVVFDSANADFFMARYDLARASETPIGPGKTGLPIWVDLTTRLTMLPAISIASIRGRTRGAGSEFALACDMRFASREKYSGNPKSPLEFTPVVARSNAFPPWLAGRAPLRSSPAATTTTPILQKDTAG